MKYAQYTSITIEKSRTDIELLLSRYGAESFKRGWVEGKEAVQFIMKRKQIRFILPLPEKNDVAFCYNKQSGTKHPEGKALLLWEQACKTAYRALVLSIKAKLATVESGISSFEEEFYANIVLPNNKTVFQNTIHQVESVYKNNRDVNLLNQNEPA